MINRIKEELNQNDLKVYATGGLAGLIVPLCKNELIHLKDLTLQGLLKIYELNQKEQL